jgi:peptide/nickel transport system substrate-binding protein
MNSRKTLAFLTLLFLLVFVLGACTPSASPTPTEAMVEEEGDDPTDAPVPTEVSAPEESTEPKVLIVGAVDDNYLHDPALPGRESVGAWPLNANIYEGLVTMGSDYQLVPLLAESWDYDAESEAWIFHLREGVTFHDGTPFNADAVVYTMEFLAQDYIGDQINLETGAVLAIDEYTVQLSNVALQAPYQMAHPAWSMRSPSADPFQDQYVGTGPFVFEEYVAGDHISVVKNEDYWGGAPDLDRIEFRFMPDPNTRVLALQAGEIDLAYTLPGEAVATLEGDDSLNLLAGPVSAYSAFTWVATGEDPFTFGSDPAVREAVGYAIDRETLVDSVFDGRAANVQTYMPPGILGGHDDLIEGYAYDPDRARQILEDAGWVDSDGDGIREKDGRDLAPVVMNGFPSAAANGTTGEVVQAMLREVGIDVQLTSIPDSATFYELLGGKQADAYIEQGNQNSASPCFLVYLLFYGSQEEPNSIQLAASPTFVGFPEVDEEIDNCRNSVDTGEAAMWAAEAFHTIVDEARTVTPLAGLYQTWGTSANVTGFEPPAVAVMAWFNNVDIEP